MTDEKKIKLRLAYNCDWGNFLLDSIALDKENKKPKGYHWFLWLYLINSKDNIFPNVDFINIQKTLPDNHELKKIDIDTVIYAKPPNKFPHLSADRLAGYIHRTRQQDIVHINFFGLHFEDSVDFSNFIFPTYVSFEKSKFSGNVNFKKAIFMDFANFKDTEFKRRIIFQGTTFKHHAPRFYGAKLNKEITWDNITWPTFPNVFWALRQDILLRIKPKSADMEYVERVRENQNSYEDLANHMEDLNKYHDQHLFFRREMGCRRRLENYFIRLFYWLYEKLSNYGYGVGHAFVSWFLHILIGALILFGLRYFNCFKDFTDDFGCSLGISLSNSHAFFFKGKRLKDCYDAFESLPWFNVVWGVQTITGTLLIFLVLLTLRVRFRLK